MRGLLPEFRRYLLAAALLLPAPGAFAVDCPLDTNPACASAIDLGTISGDSGTPVITKSGLGEAFYLVHIRESLSSLRTLNARIQLQVPTGADYDLFVRCYSCANAATRGSTAIGSVVELVNVSRADTSFADQSFVIAIEIRYYSGTSCVAWTLSVSGNTTAAAGTPALACP